MIFIITINFIKFSSHSKNATVIFITKKQKKIIHKDNIKPIEVLPKFIVFQH